MITPEGGVKRVNGRIFSEALVLPEPGLGFHMSRTAKRAAIGAAINLLCDRFPQAFTGRGQPRRPLKVGIHANLVTELGAAVRPRDLKSALRAYTSKPSYLRTLVAGAARVALDGSPAGTVTSEEETVAKARLAELTNPAPPPTAERKAPPAAQVAPTTSSISAASSTQRSAPAGPKRLSLADLREAGRRKREAAV
jgi:ProP effector